MTFHPTPIAGVYEIEVAPFADERGWFARTFCKRLFAAIGHTAEWTQLNHSFTRQHGTVRGMHYQVEPFSEVKMVKCIGGRVWDVAVDLRRNSPTFLQWHGAEISANNRRMLYIPPGCAHGFQTLDDDCQLLYHHTSYYEPSAEGGVRYDDPALNISWPLPPVGLSARDLSHPLLDGTFAGI